METEPIGLSARCQELLAEFLKLPIDEQYDLAAAFSEILHPCPEEVWAADDPGFADEIRRRAADKDPANWLTMEEFMAELRRDDDAGMEIPPKKR